MFKLFDHDDIVNKKRFGMSRYVIEGGMDAINRIAAEARVILLEYYTGCEKTYRNALRELYEYDQQSPLDLTKINGTQQRREKLQLADNNDENDDDNDNDDEDYIDRQLKREERIRRLRLRQYY